MANAPTQRGSGSFDDALYGQGGTRPPGADEWGPVVHNRMTVAPPVPRPAAGRQANQAYPGQQYAGTAAAEREPVTGRRAAVHERGWPGWLAVIALIVVTGIGAVIDEVGNSAQSTTAFDIALILGSLIAIIAVRRRSMFTVVVSPPLVYAVASFILLYLRSGGLGNRTVLLDAASNWLTYGFPAIAGAVAAVLIVAGVRLLIRR